ncbi:MAG: RpiB/LacA/LacB family sugar-phosphate isomerase, partial [Desulfomicrobium sp.]|nr:RpiB/LacA/LacB family sugar-phosphate isomerase [Desulfomicrobium sp.]
MRAIVFGSDHAGFGLKNVLMEHLSGRFEIIDVGVHSLESCDYPVMAGKLAAETIAGQAERFDVLSRIKHHSFPGGALLRTPALVLGMLYYRL